MLRDSTPQKVGFTINLLGKLMETEQRYAKRGRIWYVPKSIVPALKRFRQMARRYESAKRIALKTGQRARYQHSDAEADAEAAVALWVLNMHRQLNGSPEVASMERFNLPWLRRAS